MGINLFLKLKKNISLKYHANNIKHDRKSWFIKIIIFLKISSILILIIGFGSKLRTFYIDRIDCS